MKTFCLAFFILSFGILTAQEDAVHDSIYSSAESMPEFPGGMNGLYGFVGENLEYPKEAYSRGAEGTVFVSFIVDKNGNVQEPTVTKPVDPALDQAALEVIQKMPTWKPGTEAGEPVNVKYNLPINFLLPTKGEE